MCERDLHGEAQLQAACMEDGRGSDDEDDNKSVAILLGSNLSPAQSRRIFRGERRRCAD